MTLYRIDDLCPQVDPSAYIAHEATVIGQVIIEADASLWAGVVVRADNDTIHIGRGSNVQENTVLHTDKGIPLLVEEGVTIGHQATLHGCAIGSGSLIGIKAIILNRAVIGKDSLVGAGALVTERQRFPERSLILGAPAKVVRTLSDEEVAGLRESSRHYVERVQRFKSALVALPLTP